jgi:tetratricopeptide (TPR) repeat protein
MRWARTVFCVLVCGFWLSTLAPHSVALAATPQQKVQARELYSKGQALFREGSYTEAERAFEEAYRLVPNAVVLLSIAECEVRTEQYQRAIDTFEAYLREKPDARDASEVRGQIEALRARPAVLTVNSSVPGASVWVDQSDSGQATPAELKLAAGHHIVGLQHDGYLPAEQGVDLTPGERETLNVDLVPEAAPAPPPAPAPEPVATEQRGPRHTGTLFWVATGVGAAGLITGITLGSLALQKEKDFNKNPTTETADKGERMALFADIGFGIAAAGAVTALVVYFTSGKKGEPASDSAQAWRVAPELMRGGGGMAASARF